MEDFGIVPLEAQAAGTPVIALGIGGALETVTSGSTGVFFPKAEAEALIGAVEEFETMHFDTAVLRMAAERFSPERFRERFSAVLKRRGIDICSDNDR